MKIIKQLFFIILFFIIGELISHLIQFLFPSIFIPGTIFGMIILLLVLLTNKAKISIVDEVGTFLTSNMGFFFIPATVSIMEYFDILKPIIVQIVLICIMSSIISFFVIAYSVKLTIYFQNRIFNQRGKTE